MRQMVSSPSEGPVKQFRCTDCEWAFYVQQPLTPEVPFEVQRSYAQRWFVGHSCLEHGCLGHSRAELPGSRHEDFRRSAHPPEENLGART